MVTSPLRLLHMAQWGPPGTSGAFIVTTAEREATLKGEAVLLLGAGECETHEYITDRMALRSGPEELENLPNLTETECNVAAKAAYGMAGLLAKDMNMAQVASNFAHVEMLMLSELGFCAKQEMGAFIQFGAIDVGGALPTNTNGGWHSFGQAGAAYAQDTVIERIRQLRGTALGKQVEPRPEVGVIHGIGAVGSCHSVLVLSNSN